MKTLFKRSIIILSLLLVTGIIVYSFINTPPHQFKEGQCPFCHLNYDHPLRFRDNISTLCNYCHGKRNVLSHIVGVKPSMLIPADFHLDENNETTCATCHDIHMERTDPLTGERTQLLRSNLRGKEFCDSCHQDTHERVAGGYLPLHAEVFETAHLGTYIPNERYKIDSVSLYCLSCHEGAIAGHAAVVIRVGSPIGGSHPIGMDYIKAQTKKADLRSPKNINPEMRFFEGKVGCASCHNPFNLVKHKLSMTMEESKLCFECHLK